MHAWLREKPFFLGEGDIAWVLDTLASMTAGEKLMQLFCPMGMGRDAAMLREPVEKLGVGGVLFRPQDRATMHAVHGELQAMAKIPLLIAANLESGGSGAATDGTLYAPPYMAAATGDVKSGYRLGKIACAQGAALGCNWSFAPVVDIDMNFRNPITNLRTFGGDAQTVLAMARGYLQAAREEGVAASLKHFPGDGADERDQHLLTSVNSLAVKAWDDTFGLVYRGLIDDGALTVMAGHIAQPAYVRHFNPAASKGEQMLPATLQPLLLQNLLRDKLGFRGLVVTDASGMAGFACAMPRSRALPLAIAAGCDMILFNHNLMEDVQYIRAGFEQGIITPERLNEAVLRILGVKAALKLHEKQKSGTLVPDKQGLEVFHNEEHRQWVLECADRGITLVKDEQHLLPLSPGRHKRVYLNVLEKSMTLDTPLKNGLKQRLEALGFEVSLRDRGPGMEALFREMFSPVEALKSRYDVVMLVAHLPTFSNQTTIRLQWEYGDDMPWYVQEIPTLFISLANPYHLLDVPMVPTHINAYSPHAQALDALMDKLTGKSAFTFAMPLPKALLDIVEPAGLE